MLFSSKDDLALFVDRACSQWILRDGDGNFWAMPAVVDEPWEHRQPFEPNAQTQLEPVPGHYKVLLSLPF